MESVREEPARLARAGHAVFSRHAMMPARTAYCGNEGSIKRTVRSLALFIYVEREMCRSVDVVLLCTMVRKR